MPGDAEFAALLLARRRAAGLSQAELAELARCTRPYVSQLERAARSRPSRQVALNLADALGVRGPERSEFLSAAGWPELERSLSPELGEVDALARRVVEGSRLPGVLHDSRWTILFHNALAGALFGALGEPLVPGRSLLDQVFSPRHRRRIPGWDAWARSLLAQFKRDSAHLRHTPAQRALLGELRALPDFPRLWAGVEAAPDVTPVMPVDFVLTPPGAVRLHIVRQQFVGLPELWSVAFVPVGAEAEEMLAALLGERT
ncbi:Transcriptional regulator, contains XRE-family HTH domain [Deinococcus reticulitermitis]|uniref:Transcriptional regulator, contains XRE-family HTH domain n=1 Tax=Deinococcus reticulitermitis TaxID=856736 RepID=A0A1H6ZMV9_9DEIO|nr:helix-turn-helix domain-containing protein [Deinococcus reticulitermitis]SEJ52887.1 Transcriptional regulator, contains XRE-family HTH domain [Deinococcus reticulitermitis]